MYELYQAEWCPYSSYVREQLTERGIDFVARQVPAAKPERRELRERTGQDGIPALVDGERVIAEFEEILAFWTSATRRWRTRGSTGSAMRTGASRRGGTSYCGNTAAKDKASKSVNARTVDAVAEQSQEH